MMKKIFLFVMMAAVLGFTACSKEEAAQPGANRNGMILRAAVGQHTDSKATFTDNEGVWHFDFIKGDRITVTNKTVDAYYTFTNNGMEFFSTDAELASEPTRWYAYFPSKEVSFVGQTGKWKDLADVYALVGSTPFGSGDVRGEDGLTITMYPKCAILKIINNKGSIDINVKNSADTWIKGLKDSQASFITILVKDDKQSLLSTEEKGTYYIAVPSGIQIAVKDGDNILKSTGMSGLTAGKYYELTIDKPAPEGSQGEADANGIGKVKWVQLWAGGPKFAEYNMGVSDGMAESFGGYYCWGGIYQNGAGIPWKDDSKTHGLGSGTLSSADDSVTRLWGSNWKMPTKEDFGALLNPDNCTVERIDGVEKKYKNTDVPGLLFKGKGDYEANSLFLPGASSCYQGQIDDTDQVGQCLYWSSSWDTNDMGDTCFAYCLMSFWGYSVFLTTDIGCSVRAVLNEK